MSLLAGVDMNERKLKRVREDVRAPVLKQMRAQRHVVVGACALWILACCLAGASASGHRFAGRWQSGARRLFVAAPAVRDVNGLGPARSILSSA